MIPTTLTSVALLITETLASRGHDGLALLDELGFDRGRLHDPNGRYPSSAMKRLWQAATELAGDDCFGLAVAGRMQPASLHGIGFAWLASLNLAEAMQRYARYCRVASTAMQARVVTGDDRVCLQVKINDSTPLPLPAPAAVDALAAGLTRLCRWSAGEDFRPAALALVRPRPSARCLGRW